jgi:hypothetical protein
LNKCKNVTGLHNTTNGLHNWEKIKSFIA